MERISCEIQKKEKNKNSNKKKQSRWLEQWWKMCEIDTSHRAQFINKYSGKESTIVCTLSIKLGGIISSGEF